MQSGLQGMYFASFEFWGKCVAFGVGSKTDGFDLFRLWRRHKMDVAVRLMTESLFEMRMKY